jgi:hypothetical protein
VNDNNCTSTVENRSRRASHVSATTSNSHIAMSMASHDEGLHDLAAQVGQLGSISPYIMILTAYRSHVYFGSNHLISSRLSKILQKSPFFRDPWYQMLDLLLNFANGSRTCYRLLGLLIT